MITDKTTQDLKEALNACGNAGKILKNFNEQYDVISSFLVQQKDWELLEGCQKAYYYLYLKGRTAKGLRLFTSTAKKIRRRYL